MYSTCKGQLLQWQYFIQNLEKEAKKLKVCENYFIIFDIDSILVWLFPLICKGTILTTGAGGPYYITVGGHSSAEVAKSQKHVINEVVSDFISQDNVVNAGMVC